MNRIYCRDCKQFMIKERQGFTVGLGETGVSVRGDEYKCRTCGKVIYGDFGEPFEVGKK